MVPDRHKLWTDGRTDGWTDGRMDGRTHDAKTISLRLRRGIIKKEICYGQDYSKKLGQRSRSRS